MRQVRSRTLQFSTLVELGSEKNVIHRKVRENGSTDFRDFAHADGILESRKDNVRRFFEKFFVFKISGKSA